MPYDQVLNQNQKVNSKTPVEFGELGGLIVTKVYVLSYIKVICALLHPLGFCPTKYVCQDDLKKKILENIDVNMHSDTLRQKFRHLAPI